ncbi:MAG: creatininase family protein [Betaproteobacteria bacterium]|nr:creatininase family protein [Betaproteobacteria bacterium]
MTAYAMQDMTWPEVKEALETVKVAILPVGSQEQHGPHLACNVDIAGAEAFALMLAEKVHPLAMLAPPLNYGISYHHMLFPGSLTLRPETFIQVLIDVATSLRQQGIRRIFVVNGHGGNQSALDIASVKMRADLGMRMSYTLWPVLGEMSIVKDQNVKRHTGHACIYETSLMMHLRPDIVRDEALAEGEMQPPLYGDVSTTGIGGFAYWNEITRNGAFEGAPEATAEIGEKIVQLALERATSFVRQFAQIDVEKQSLMHFK